MSTEKAKSRGEGEEYEDKPDADQCSEQHCYPDEQGGIWFMGKNPDRGWQTKGKSKGRCILTECATSAGRRGTKAVTSGLKGAKAKEEYAKSVHGYTGGYNHNSSNYRERVKILHACDSQSFCTSAAARGSEPR